MTRTLRNPLLVLALIGIAGTANAQNVVYRNCVIEDVPSATAALTTFYESIEGVEKPVATLIDDIFNGDSPVTHVLVEDFSSYEALEAWRNRVGESQGALLQLIASTSNVATCESEGFAIEVDYWGDRENQGDYHFVFSVSTSDAAAYAAALERLTEDLEDIAPGPTGLYANRSGVEEATHFVVQWGSSLAALNHWADEYPQTDAFERFREEVGSIRSVGRVYQRQTIATWNAE